MTDLPDHRSGHSGQIHAGMREIYGELLASLERRGLKRQTRPSPRDARDDRVVDFSSNDYLNLARHQRLVDALTDAARRYGVGAGAARLMSGNYRLHGMVEVAIAMFKRSEAAVLYPSGYGANTGLIPVLAGPDSELFSDERNHASIIDGIRLSRARMTSFRHNDPEDLAQKLFRSKARRRVIVTEGVFSMDGDVAPLPEILGLADRFGAWVVVDEAHATGVLGPGGTGTFAEFGLEPGGDVVQVVTLGKAFGVAGGAVAGPRVLCDVLQSRSRSWIFSTAPPPPLAGAILEAINTVTLEPGIVAHLRDLCGYFAARLGELGIDSDPRTPIFPVIVDSETRALEAAHRLGERGLFVQAVRPPTVPRGTARLRISVTTAHGKEELDRMIEGLRDVL